MDDAVDWKHGGPHMLEKHGTTVVEAEEVLSDPDALWFDPDPKGRSGSSIRVIGYSHTAKAVMIVILVREDDTVFGANCWKANSTERRLYREG